ncbi:DNA ligase 1-like [Phragmites australis]|uniref:DNA ligase 1-like n=1 Tax=Phragmites australis TaxID=29695 RepID=UPI002D779E54|nr:DNA ligase 1-like [Phragmites australis]
MFLLRATTTTSSLLLRCHPLPSPKTLALAPPPPLLPYRIRPRLSSSSSAASPASPRRRATATAAAKSGEKKPPTARAKRAGVVPAPAAVAAAMSSSGGNGGKRTVADVLMGNARAAASKAKKAAPSPKKPRTQPAAQADGAEAEPEAAAPAPAVKPPPSPVRSKRASSPAKSSKSPFDGAAGEKKRSTSPTRSKGLAAAAQLEEVKEKSPSPKRSKTLAAKSDAKPSNEGVISESDGKKKRSPSPTKAKGQTSQPEEKKRPSSPKRVKTLDAPKSEEKNDGKKKRSPSPTKAKGQTSQPEEKKRPSSPKRVKTLDAPKSEEKNTTLELKKKGTEFDPVAAAYWRPGEPVPFLFLARALDLISNESGRIIITEILSNVFRTVIATTPDDLLATVYLSANRIAPPHEGIELGIGDASIIRALAEAYGRKEEHVKKNLKELGDLGLVAKASRSSQKMMYKPKPLTIARVISIFRTIAKESGKDSQDKKRNHIKGLLVAATDCEPQYITRLLQSKMRIGLAEKTVQMALGQAAVYSDKKSSPPKVQSPFEEAATIIKQVYSVLPIYDKIVPVLLEVGVWKLPETCKFSIGVPVGPMLAKATKSVSEIIDKFQGLEYTCEYKYDGERAQIHCMEDGSVEIYSRNAERNTGKYPDVVDAVSRFRKPTVKSFVLDCEIVAYDREKQKILPFQILSTRARKGVTINDIKVSVCTFGFDILYINGKPLLQEQLKVRREHLYNSFEEVPGVFQFATAITSNDLEEIQKFLDTAVNSSCEGLIIKTLDKDATYEPAKRSNNWLKLKKDYMDSIGDSLDLVPIAAFFGRGKRTGVYGSFLLACYDEQNEEYQTICNIGTGFSEQQLEERSASLRSKVIEKPKAYYRFADTMDPDVWFEPSEVWEVKAADLSISPVHRAANGIVDPNKGISLRFPRLLRVRDDKSPEEATSSEQVADMYRAQKINHGYNQEDEDDD